MSLVIPTVLGILVLVALAVAIRTIRSRPKPPPTVDLSSQAWTREMARWVRSQPSDMDFPRYADWRAEKALEYQQRYGVWPENY